MAGGAAPPPSIRVSAKDLTGAPRSILRLQIPRPRERVVRLPPLTTNPLLHDPLRPRRDGDRSRRRDRRRRPRLHRGRHGPPGVPRARPRPGPRGGDRRRGSVSRPRPRTRPRRERERGPPRPRRSIRPPRRVRVRAPPPQDPRDPRRVPTPRLPAPPPRPGGAPPAPGGSPGFRRRNYIREAPEEDDRRAGGPDPAAALDPLAVPVGGHRPKPALVLPLSDDEGEVVVTGAREAREARRRRDSGVPTREGGSAAAAEELWSALDREAKAARRDADAETKNPPTFDPRLRTIAGGRAVPEAATAALVEAFMAEEAARRRGKAADGSAKARRKAPRGPGASARRSKRAKPSRDEPEPECIGAEDASRDEAEPEAGAQDASDASGNPSGDGPNASGNRSNATPAADADALPAPLERLARLYEASARAAAFLASQRVRATWKHLEPLTRGAGVALGDLEAMAALAPGSASLSRRRALRRDEARDDGGVSGGGERASFGAGRGGDGGDEILVDLTVPGTARVRLAAGLGGDTPAPPRDEDEGSPEPADEPLATVVHGSRPGARTYDAGSSEDDVHEDAPRDAEGGRPRGVRGLLRPRGLRARLWGRGRAGSRLGERRRSAPSSRPSRRARGTTVPARARNPTKPPRTTTRGAKKTAAAGLPNGRANGRRTNGKHPKPPPPVSTRTSRSPPPSANAAPPRRRERERAPRPRA